MENRQTETSLPPTSETQAITAVGSTTITQEPVRVDVSVMVSARQGEGRPTLAVSELPEEADTVDQSRTGKKNIHKRLMFEGMLHLPVMTNKKPPTSMDVHSMDRPRPNRLLTRHSLFDVLVRGSYGAHPEGLDETAQRTNEEPNEEPIEDQGQRALVLRKTTEVTVFDEEKIDLHPVPPQEFEEAFMLPSDAFSPSVVEALLAETTHKTARFGKRSTEEFVGILPSTPIVPDSEQTESVPFDLSLVKLLGGEKGIIVPDDVPWLLPLEENSAVAAVCASLADVSAQEEVAVVDAPIVTDEMPTCIQMEVDASVAAEQEPTQENSSVHVTQPSIANVEPSAVRGLAQGTEKSAIQALVPHHRESLVRATMGECKLTELLPDDLNVASRGCEVPVQSLGLGIAYALGDAVSLVVKSGKSVAVRVVSQENKKQKPRKTPISHAPSELTARMGGRVIHGVRGVFSGGRIILHGGKDVVLGTAGCLVGTAECLTNILLPGPKSLSHS